jgi:hypothetical protein
VTGIVGGPVFWVIVVMVGSLAPILIAAAISAHRRERLLRTCGVGATGRILELGHHDDGVGNVSDWAKVEYPGHGGHNETAIVNLPSEIGNYHVGQRVYLTYVPGRSIVRLDSW